MELDLIPKINYVILTFLLLAALGTLVFGLRKHWERIQQGKPFFATKTPELSALFAQANWRAFFSRAALNSRLFKRPVSGVAHALVFFGSIVLIIGHAVFPLTFLGVPVFEGSFGYWFMAIGRDAGGVAVILGVLFFLCRRLSPPERLKEPTLRTGFVVVEILFLVTLCAGFATEALRIAFTEPHAGKFVGNVLAGWIGHVDFTTYHLSWWIHGLLGLAVIAHIARTPFSHMLLGPINTALAPARDGISLRPMKFDFDEDEEEEAEEEEIVLGAVKLLDLGQKNLLDFATCLWCGRCHEVCPATQTGKPLSPKGVMLTCAQYLSDDKLDDDTLIDAIGMQAIFDCVTCAACVEVCPVSINPPETILEFRRQFVMERSEMPETMAAANRNLESREHPFVGTGASPEAWRQGLDVPIFEKGSTEYLLWIGCAVTYEERAQNVARAMVRILDQAGVSYGILEEARCTGDPAKQMGNEMQFVEIAQQNIEEFKEEGIQKIITMCAHCFNSFDRYYPELGANFETIPHSVLIDQLIRAGKLKVSKQATQKITFHDPCYLARHNGIIDETRGAISALGALVEMPRTKKDSFCGVVRAAPRGSAMCGLKRPWQPGPIRSPRRVRFVC